MVDKIQPLSSNFQIVDKNGNPNAYFIRYMQQQLGVGFAPLSRVIATGKGLTGGGDLSEDRTISLDATLGDLNDVDETTNPPTDGQVLTFIAADGKWEPADSAGGGGVAGEAAWMVDAVGTGASQNVAIPDIDPTKQRVMVFVNGLRWATTEYTIAGNIATLTTNSAGDSIEIVGPLGKADGTAFVVDAVGTGAPQNVTIPFALPTTQSVMVFVNGLRWATTEYTIAGNAINLTTNSAGDSIEIVGPLGFVTVGGGGASPYDGPATLPKVADFTPINFAGTTTAVDGITALVFKETANLNQALRILGQVPPVAPWRVYMRAANGFLGIPGGGDPSLGITIGDSTGRYVNPGRNGEVAYAIKRWNALNGGYNGTIFNGGVGGLTMPLWQSVENDGTNINFYLSLDGFQWVKMFTQALGVDLTDTVVVGPGIVNSASGSGVEIDVYSWSFTAPVAP